MPKVSIVLPTYNGQQFLEKSLNSIIEQTFKDWELIIVNDCSTDDTLEIIETYIAKDSRIRVISNSINKKLPMSLNIGFRDAKGELFTWTSDDNVFLPNAIEEMVSYLSKNENEFMVCAGMNWIDSEDKFLFEHIKYSNRNMYLNDCVGACFMYRKAVVESIGEYDTSLFLVEDYEYWLRILFKYGNIAYIDKILYLYRIHEGSLTGSRKNEIHQKLLELRMCYLPEILNNISEDKEILCNLYFDFLNNNKIEGLEFKFKSLVPELEIVSQNVNDRRDYIVYGAGNYGVELSNKYKTKVKFFADRNVNKIGKKINGIEVISLAKMFELSSQYTIIIAVSLEHVYSLLKVLYNNNIRECSVYTTYDENRHRKE